MIKQEKPAISPPPSPHWRRLQQPSGVVGRILGKPAASILRPSTLVDKRETPQADQAITAKALLKPLSPLPNSRNITRSIPESKQSFWRHIPVISWWLSFQLALAKRIIKIFLNHTQKNQEQPAPEQLTSKQPIPASSSTTAATQSLVPTPPTTHDPLQWLGQWLGKILFWGTGAFVIILPIQWMLQVYERIQKGIIGGLSEKFDTQKSSQIPKWVREILLIVLGTLLLPLYVRGVLVSGSLRGMWYSIRKSILVGTHFLLYFPLAIFLVSILIGNQWLSPSQYPDINQWAKAVDKY